MAVLRRRLPSGRRNVRRPLKRWRRVVFEPLECRLPLDGGLVNSALSAVQRQALLNGLNGVATWSDSLANYNKLAQQLSIVDTSIGQELDVRSILQNQIVAPLNAATAATTDALVTSLKGLSTTAGGLVVTVNPASVTGGLLTSAQGDELQFTLTLDATRTRPSSLDLGADALNAGLQLNPATTAPLTSSLHFAFTSGIDLQPGLNAGETFFVRVASLGESVAINANSFNAAAQVGVLDVQAQGASLNLAAAIAVGVINPDADSKGNVTLTELQSTN